MSDPSSYTSNLFPSQTYASSSSKPSSSKVSSASNSGYPKRIPAGTSSHFQFDPLLRSTFGHRSVDLYGSQVDNEEDERIGRGGASSYRDEGDDDDISPAVSFHQGASAARGARRGGGQLGHHPSYPSATSSTLLHASRYGPAKITRSGAGMDIPEISDEEDEDEQVEREQRWGRGLDVRAFDTKAGARGGTGQDSVDSIASRDADEYTPNASLLQGGHTTQTGPSGQLASAGVDPFEVEDEEGHDSHPRQRSHPTNTQKSHSSPTDKGKARFNTTPLLRKLQRDVSSGRGWLAHSIAPPSKKNHSTSPGRRVRPPRDAYSIYDDEDEAAFSSEGEDEVDDQGTQSEASEDDDRTQQSTPFAGDTERSLYRDGQASTIHHPAKLDASSFPDRAKSIAKTPYQDDFAIRVAERTGLGRNGRTGSPKKSSAFRSAASAEPSTTPAEPPTSDSIFQDPPPLVGHRGTVPSLNLYSWLPFSRGNNPAFKEWKDVPALLVWAIALLVTLLVAGGASLGVRSPLPPSTPSVRPSPYYTLTRSLPLLVLLSALSLTMAVLHLAFLRNLDKFGGARILRFVLIVVPSTLTLGWLWAFGASFFYSDESWSGGLWSTLGLRVLSLFPLLCAVAFSRLLYLRRHQLERSLSVLSLSARIVSAHPSLLILAVLQIFLFLALSILFLTIFIRLFLLGHFYHPAPNASTEAGDVWITDRKARVLAWFTLATWIWTWSALRGIMRVIVAATVSHWYFYGPPSREVEDEESGPTAGAFAKGGRGVVEEEEEDARTADGSIADGEDSEIVGHGELEDEGDETRRDGFNRSSPYAHQRQDPAQDQEGPLAHRNPTSSNLVRSSFLRATGPSLGTILLSALLLSLSTTLLILSSVARLLASLLSSPSIPLPTLFHPLAHLAYLLSGVGNVLGEMSEYTLIYSGITGRGFWKSTRRCGRLVARRGVKGIMEGLLISTILSLLSISLSFLAALAGFLFSAHQLHVPADAPLVGLICGIVPYWVLRLSGDLLGDGADTLYLCYAIDTSGPFSTSNPSNDTAGIRIPGSFPAEGTQPSIPSTATTTTTPPHEGLGIRGEGTADQVGRVFAGVEVDDSFQDDDDDDGEGEGEGDEGSLLPL